MPAGDVWKVSKIYQNYCIKSVYLQSKSLYSVRLRENTDQKNSEYGHFLRSELSSMISERKFVLKYFKILAFVSALLHAFHYALYRIIAHDFSLELDINFRLKIVFTSIKVCLGLVSCLQSIKLKSLFALLNISFMLTLIFSLMKIDVSDSKNKEGFKT